MTIDIKTLFKLCTIEIKKGNADKKILISSDDEGNSYHELFFGFENDLKDYEDFIYCIDKEDLKNYIILG